MPPSAPFQRVILRSVLREVSPMVIRVLAVPEDTELADLHEMFQALMGWAWISATRGYGREAAMRRNRRGQTEA